MADDEPALVRAASRILTARPDLRDVVIVPSGDVPEAIAAFDRESGAIRAILSDMMMPGGLGLDLYRHVRRTHPQMPFAFWSGGMPVEIAGALDAVLAADERATFFHKPVSFEPLAAWARGALMVSGL